MWQAIIAVVGSAAGTVFDTIEIHKKSEPSQGPLRVDLLPRSRGYMKRKVKLQLFIKQDDNAPWATIEVTHDIPPTGLAKSCLDLCMLWLENCNLQKALHDQCPRPEVGDIPTRILKWTFENGGVCLHSPSPDGKASYVALSHCWGGTSPLTTTLSNLISHTLGIPWLSIPPTFRDALLVTHQLGLEYLWIDSLCIIQDSPEDWAVESANMAKVYENAWVTIAADAAVNSTTGFLDPPARHKMPVHDIQYQKEDGTTGHVYIREKGPLAGQLPYHGWQASSVTSPKPLDDSYKYYSIPVMYKRSKLSTRGWVFQERILSPRTIYFAKSETAWECNGAIACKCTYTSKRKRRGKSLLKGSFAEEDWKTLVEEYSALDLTVQIDRLPAISGLAEAIGRRNLDNEYLCGLWKNQLAEQLLWQLTHNPTEKRKRE